MSALAPHVHPIVVRTPRQTFGEWWSWTRRHGGDVRADAAAAAMPPAHLSGSSDERGCRVAWRSEIGIFARWVSERAEQLEPRRIAPSVLDAGCGSGTHALLFAALGAESHGLDLRPERIAAAARSAAAWSAVRDEALDVSFERADLAKEWNRRYDAIWFHDVLGEAEEPDAMLAQARAHLAPGGVVGVAEWNGAHTGPSRHPRPVTSARSLRSRLVAHGFEVVLHAFPWGCGLVVPDGIYDRWIAPPLHHGWAGRAFARRQIALATLR